MATPSKPVALRMPVPASHHAMSVSEACEELWSVQEAVQALPWLQLLHEALLRDAVNSYDPSEAFLCLQGAALRFPQSLDIWKLSLWCVAALVQVCIGPAWRSQRLEPFTQQHSTSTTVSDSSFDSSPRLQNSPRSFSPAVSDLGHAAPQPHVTVAYPYIPEVLPGAILRFAASAPQADRNLAEAQRVLVLALITFNNNDIEEDNPGPRLEWTIPGAHEPVETMLMFWFESAEKARPECTKEEVLQRPFIESSLQQEIEEREEKLWHRLSRRHLDWWYALQVARACSDLVSTGWRPLANSVVVWHLVDIAQKGIALDNIPLIAIEQEAREERLAATSTAAEAISSLAALGSRGWLPHSRELVTRLINLQATACEPSTFVSKLYPLPPLTGSDIMPADWLQERDTFSSQRNSVFADTADLLWVLLAQTSSSELVIDTMFQHLGDIPEAAVTVRVVSGALWGKAPNVPGIAALRVYWKEFIERLVDVSKSVFIDVVARKQGCLGRSEMTLALEVVVALGRLVDNELIRGRGILAPDEWLAFQSSLEQAILPNIEFDEDLVTNLYLPLDERKSQNPHKLFHRIRTETEGLFWNLGLYLDKCSTFETFQYHLIVDDERRDALHFLLLRKVVPLLSEGPSLAVKVYRSWACVSFLPDRRDSWVKTAKMMVAEAFAINQVSPSRHHGYAHSPVVRLEALLLITSDDAYRNSCGDSQTTEPTSVNEKPDTSLMLLSPLSSAKFFPEYSELVNTVILPCFSLIFEQNLTYENMHGEVLKYRSPNAVPDLVPVNDDLISFIRIEKSIWEKRSIEDDNNDFKLRRFSIDLMGQLFCSIVATAELRLLLIDMLKKISIMEVIQFPGGAIVEDDALGERLSTLITNRSLLALEAIGQIETSMCGPFFSLPNAHDVLPKVIEALCGILIHYASIQSVVGANPIQMQVQYSYRLLSFASLLPLARLRRAPNGGLLLLEREEAMLHLPEGIVALFSERECEMIDDEGPFIAPFVRVDQVERHRNKRELTSTNVSFDQLVEVLMQILGQHGEVPNFSDSDEQVARERDMELKNRFRSSCYDIVLSLVLSGLSFPKTPIFDTLVPLPPSKGPYSGTETFTRLRASLAVFQGTLKYSGAPDVAVSLENLDRLLSQLLGLLRSGRPEDVVVGCKMLIGIFPSIKSCYSIVSTKALLHQFYWKILDSTATCVHDYACQMKLTGNSPETHFRQRKIGQSTLDVGPSLLLVLYQSTLYFFDFFDELEGEKSRNLVRSCFDVASNLQACRPCRTLAVRCAAFVLDRMKRIDIETLLQEYFRASDDDLSATTDVSLASQLEVPDSDLIRCAMIYKAIAVANGNEREGVPRENLHYVLAKQVDNVKSFDRSKDYSAAWLCGDHLLTCKVGGKMSRNCGWVEIVLRGATFCRRELVRLSSSVSIDNPEIPSSLWNGKASSIGSETAVERKRFTNFTLPPVRGDDTALRKAMSLVERSELVLGTDNRPNESVPPDDSHEASDHKRHGGRTETGNHTESLRNVSSDDSQTSVVNESKGHVALETVDPDCIRDWLRDVLDDPMHIVDVLSRLSALGLESVVEHGKKKGDPSSVVDVGSELLPVTRLSMDDKTERAIKLLDRTVSLDTHKIALLYASSPSGSKKHRDETEVDFYLEAESASPSFFDFANGLGELVLTRHLKYFSAGFDTSGSDTDGEYALIWIQSSNSSTTSSQCLTIYHAVPFMPPSVNNRKRHVGNDCVHIVFVDPSSYLHELLWASGMEEEMESILISGEFGFVTIFVIPIDKGTCRVKVQLKPGLKEKTRLQLTHIPGEDIVSMTEAPQFVRRLANLADTACSAAMDDILGPPTSWEMRIRQLRHMKRHALQTSSH